MAGGKHRSRKTIIRDTRKGSLLSADERAAAKRMKRNRMSVQAIARAIGRSVPDVQAFLASPEGRVDG